MKTSLVVCLLWTLSALSGFCASYALVIPNGLSPIANHLDNGAGNRFDQLFPNPGGFRDGDTIQKLKCDGSFTVWVLDSASPTGFSDLAANPIAPGTLVPGEGAFYGNYNGIYTVTFTGTLPIPVFPVNLPCGCGQENFLSRPTVGNGTYENVTGRQPQDGSTVERWNGLVYVTNVFSGGAWSLGAPSVLAVGESGLFFVPCAKWDQAPDTSTNGLDVRATNPKILASDFRCNATGPITEIRIRGSWLNDNTSTQGCFCLGIWSDIPRVGTNFSRPGTQLCNWCFSPDQYSSLIYSNAVNERFYDPNIPGTNGLIGSDTIIREYVFNIPTNQACIQTNGSIYWLSVTMDCVPTNFLFGWKTCPTNFNDDAVYGHVAGTNTPLMDWAELRRPGTTNSLDLSFTITTVTNSLVNQSNRPVTLVLQKWLQIPDTTTNGLDVRATNPKILADDFMCTNTGPITEVKVWASWLDDQLAPATCFCLGIWSDLPPSATNLFSRPDKQLCSYCFNPGQYFLSPYTNSLEQFFDPNIPGIVGSDTIIWEYDFHFTNTCWQTNGNIYWLSVTANCFDTNKYLFGWKTCPTNWNDDAVFGHVDFTNGPLGDWKDLKRPPFYYTSLDLAFEIDTETNICSCTNRPSISCPSDIDVTSCGTNISWSLSATSSCSSVTVVSSPPSGSFFSGNTTNTVTVVATDECGRTNSCSFLVTVHRPTLSISTGGTPGTVTISWPDGGILQEATSLLGPWADLPLAHSPYSTAASASQKFYRLRCP